MNGVDPACIVTALFAEGLLTREERDKATHRTLTANEQLKEIYAALERRVSTNPKNFHTLVNVLRNEPALKDVGDQLQGIYVAILEYITFFLIVYHTKKVFLRKNVESQLNHLLLPPIVRQRTEGRKRESQVILLVGRRGKSCFNDT